MHGTHEPDLSDFPRPKVVPPLDPDFRPLALAHREFCHRSRERGTIAVWRGDDLVKSIEVPVASAHLIERAVKFLLWQVGGDKVTLSGCGDATAYVSHCYSQSGPRAFDADIVGQKMFGRALVVEESDEPPQVATTAHKRRIGRHLDGCRIGFDLGASDRKVAAVIEGEAVFTEEVVWDPRGNADPAYHKREIVAGINKAAKHLPRIDAIGGSTAGVVIDNRIMVSSLFRGVSESDYAKAQNIFMEIREEMGVPMEVANDGDVTALAGSMALDRGRLLGIAMGSSQAGGYVDTNGDVTGWLNELAFAPIDGSVDAPADEWSGDIGCGVQSLSQQAVFRLAQKIGIDLTTTDVLAEKLLTAQDLLEAGDERAELIWRTIGVEFGFALAHYVSFYDLGNVLLLGRVASGRGGSIIVEEARRVLEIEFPELVSGLTIELPDERSRRVGQAVAAASLPSIR